MEKVLASTGSAKTLKVSQERERKALLERCRIDSDEESEAWNGSDRDEGGEQAQQQESSWMIVPNDVSGFLWKKNPGKIVLFKQWKWRYVVLIEGKLQWYASENEGDTRKGMKGEIDFSINPCGVERVPDSETQFKITPQDGKWVLGGFTGASEGREFIFDARNSQIERDTWINSIRCHLQHGGTSFNGIRPSAMAW